MLVFVTVIGVVGSVVTIITALRLTRLRHLRLAYSYEWQRVPERYARAKTRVWILQTWIPDLGTQDSHWHSALRNGAKFRVLLLNPSLVKHRQQYREDPAAGALTAQNARALQELAGQYNTKVETVVQARFYSCLPFGPISIVDDDVFWGIYPAHKDSMDLRAFRTSTKSSLGREILRSFERAWSQGEHVAGTLSLPPELPATEDEGIGARPRNPIAADLEMTETVKRTKRRLRVNDGIPSLARGVLAIIRHAETDLNAAELFSGGLDVGVNASGRHQAAQLRGALSGTSWDRIFSSPLRRALDTLLIGLPSSSSGPEARNELTERSMGDLDGLHKDGYRELPWYRGVDLDSPHVAPAGGESLVQVLLRAAPFVEEAVGLVEAGKNVLVCTHENVIRVIRVMLEEDVSLEDALSAPFENSQIRVYLAR